MQTSMSNPAPSGGPRAAGSTRLPPYRRTAWRKVCIYLVYEGGIPADDHRGGDDEGLIDEIAGLIARKRDGHDRHRGPDHRRARRRFDSGADRGAGRGAPRRSNDRGRAPTRSRSPARASRDDAVVNAPTSDWSATRFSAQPHKRRTCLRPNKAIGEAGGASSFVRAVAAGARSGQQSKIRTDSGESGTAGTKPRGPAQQGRRRWNTRWD